MSRTHLLKSFAATAFAALALFATAAMAQTDITPMNPPQPVENDGKIEVLEFFSYACPHCASLDPDLQAWTKRQPADVKFKRIPVDGINGVVGVVAIFYGLEALGELDRLHSKVFEAFHVEHLILSNPAILNKWLAKNGVDPKKFEEVVKSFSVVNKITRARDMNNNYKIPSVPTMVVNGRFMVAQVAGADRLLGQIDRLVAQTRGPAAAAAAPAPKAQPPKK